MKFSKIRLPNFNMRGKMPKSAYIVTSVILLAAIFLLTISCSSRTFHETLESIANTLPEEKRSEISNKVASSTPAPTGEIANKVSSKTTRTTTTTTESFVSDMYFKDTPTPFPGNVINPSAWSPPLNTAELDSSPLSLNNLDMFKSAHYSPQCCAKGPSSGLSTSMGCVCLSNKDAYFITEGRGGNNMNPSAII